MPEQWKEAIESTESSTSQNLEQLKNDIISDAINKITQCDTGFFWKIKHKLLKNYLTTSWKRWESFENKIIETLWWSMITPEIKQLRESLISAQTVSELNEIKTSLLHDIEVSYAEKKDKKNDNKRESADNKSETKEHYEIDKFNINITAEHEELYKQLQWHEKPDIEPFACAIKWYEELKWNLKNPQYLTVIDFTKPNTENRFYVIDMTSKTVEYATTVWHWQWSWKWQYATSFSDINWSYQSSLWFFRTPSSLFKPTNRDRSWLLMNGIEDSNDNAKSRWIYMHPGWLISLWCFTLPQNKSSEIMDKVKWDSLLFAYAKSKDYFSQSKYFETTSTWDVLAA